MLESRQASQRLEGWIAERVKDAHFRVAAGALGLLGGLVRVLPSLMARHLPALLPLVRFSWEFFCLFLLRLLFGGGGEDGTEALTTTHYTTAHYYTTSHQRHVALKRTRTGTTKIRVALFWPYHL